MLVSEITIIVALVLVNGVFAGAEIAVIALRHWRIEELADRDRASARAVLALRKDPERFLATVQVGITVVSATAAAFGGASLAGHIVPLLPRGGFLGEHAQTVAVGLVVALVSYLSVVVGELVPKSLALRSAERYALLIGRPLLALSSLARPVVWLLSASANLLLKPFGDRTTFTEARLSPEELQERVEEATEAGMIHPDVGEIVSRALDFPELAASDVMVPRRDLIMVPRNASAELIRQTLAAHPHSRLPVYERHIDNVVGYIGVKDLVVPALAQQSIAIDDILRQPPFVPESKPAVALLREMRAQHVPFAVVIDEQGGTAGIITMVDLVEELVGEIWSEQIQHPPQPIRKEPDGSFLVHGSVPLREVNRALDIELPEEGDFTTIAGLCLSLAGRVPQTGESLTAPDGITLEIADASPRRVRAVRVRV